MATNNVNRRRQLCAAAILLCLLCPVASWADMFGNTLYQGSLSWTTDYTVDPATYTGSEQLIASDGWAQPTTSIAWSVTPDGVDGSWRYLYEFTVYESQDSSGNWQIKDVSHMILEVSDGFDVYDPLDYVGNDPDPEEEGDNAKLYSLAASNPYMPDSIYGVSFMWAAGAQTDILDETDRVVGHTWTLTFDSFRNPEWGNFYAKDGTQDDIFATAWNSGLSGGEAYISRPDTSYIPVPGAGLLALLGLGAAGVKLRKFA